MRKRKNSVGFPVPKLFIIVPFYAPPPSSPFFSAPLSSPFICLRSADPVRQLLPCPKNYKRQKR